jgi:hypothetical protein
MLTAIDLHNEILLETDTIRDVRADRTLTAELGSFELAIPQIAPQALLGVGLRSAEFAGAVS